MGKSALSKSEKQSVLLSIVVPCYNVAETIHRFFDHLECSNSLDKLEVILVNDGSTDDTGIVLSEIARKFPTVVHVINQLNGGHGAAMSSGIAASTGTFCRPVDGDDWLDPVGLDKTISYLGETNIEDMLIFDYKKVNLSDEFEETIKYILPDEVFHLETLVKKKVQIVYHGCIFRTSLLKKNVTFDHHCFYVDNEYIVYPIPNVKSIRYLPWPLYVHTVGSQEQSTSMQNFRKHVDDMETVISSLFRFAENPRLTSVQKEYVYIGLDGFLSLFANVCMSMSYREGKTLFIKTCFSILQHAPDFIRESHAGVFSTFNILRISRYRGYGLIRFVKLHILKNHSIAW